MSIGAVAGRWRTSNPAFNSGAFSGLGSLTGTGQAMTVSGTVNKTAVLLLLAVITAAFTWSRYEAGAGVGVWVVVGLIGARSFLNRVTSAARSPPISAPIYALFEGLALGGISAFFESAYPGIVIPAVALTFGVLACLLAVYRTGIIPVTSTFRTIVVSATAAIFLVYLVSIVLSLFGGGIPFIHDGGPIGILFSLVVVVVASLNLVLDFDLIERGAALGAPKFMEWYAAFALMVTLVWLYLEMLRLLSKLRRN
jgi:uncharacterized YccA/Bax inhibitor family protein